MYCRVSPLSCTCNSKSISKTTQWFNLFIVTKRISEWCHFCKSKFLYIVNSPGGSFCWNKVPDTLYSNYAGNNVCCNYANFEALLQLCMWYFMLQLCWWILLLHHAFDCFCCNYPVRSFCSTYASDMSLTIFIEYVNAGI